MTTSTPPNQRIFEVGIVVDTVCVSGTDRWNAVKDRSAVPDVNDVIGPVAPVGPVFPVGPV